MKRNRRVERGYKRITKRMGVKTNDVKDKSKGEIIWEKKSESVEKYKRKRINFVY